MCALRALVLTLLSALAAGATAERAESALFFAFNRTAAKPGERVALRTPWTPRGFDVRRDGARPLQHPIPLYLVSNSIAEDVTSSDDPRLHHLGSIVLDRNGRGVLRFSVPALRSDRYAVAGVCVQCAPYSRGTTFFVLPVGRRTVAREWSTAMLLRVDAASEAVPAKGNDNAPVSFWPLVSLFGVLGLGLFARRRRHGARRDLRTRS